MKYPFCLLCCTLALLTGKAQTANRITVHPIGKDSVNIVMNDKYNLVDDSCATIVRYGHYNVSTHKFLGAFKDLSKDDPAQVRAQGTYNAAGLKDGDFVSYYSNGNLQSKGSYKDGKYIGKWEIYYKNGKPELNFEADNSGLIRIMDSWNNKGLKVIDNGKGTYQVNMASITWKGDLSDGYPDGQWTAVSRGSMSQNILISENFKKGKFQKGRSQAGDYNDASHLAIIDPALLPYLNSEDLTTAPNGCDAPKRPRVTGAKLPNGSTDFNNGINALINPYLATTDYKKWEDEVTFQGVISSEGIPGNFKCLTLFKPAIADGIISRLSRLPAFIPATVSGKPVPQGLTITFRFHGGVYSFGYKVLPLKTE